MAVQEIPVSFEPASNNMVVSLDGTPYDLKFYFNLRRAVWYMSIRTQDKEDIIQGVPLFVGWPPLERFKDTRLPPGMFMVLDTSDKNLDPTFEDFGNRVKLLYIEIGTVFT